MSKRAAVAACAAILVGSIAPGASPAAAGDRHHHHAVAVLHVAPHVNHWYHQPPLIGTGPGYYYSHHPDHVPGYPKPLTGTPVPLYRTDRPMMYALPRHRVVSTAHVEWCAARYRSYDVRTDTYQPYHGPRRRCWSPVR